MSALICVLYVISGTFKSWQPKIRAPSCTLGCRCMCTWHAAGDCCSVFYEWACNRNSPRPFDLRGDNNCQCCVLCPQREEGLQGELQWSGVDTLAGGLAGVWTCCLVLCRGVMLPTGCSKGFLLEMEGWSMAWTFGSVVWLRAWKARAGEGRLSVSIHVSWCKILS